MDSGPAHLMPGLDPGIHHLQETALLLMDCRVTQCDDALRAFARQLTGTGTTDGTCACDITPHDSASRYCLSRPYWWAALSGDSRPWPTQAATTTPSAAPTMSRRARRNMSPAARTAMFNATTPTRAPTARSAISANTC